MKSKLYLKGIHTQIHNSQLEIWYLKTESFYTQKSRHECRFYKYTYIEFPGKIVFYSLFSPYRTLIFILYISKLLISYCFKIKRIGDRIGLLQKLVFIYEMKLFLQKLY